MRGAPLPVRSFHTYVDVQVTSFADPEHVISCLGYENLPPELQRDKLPGSLPSTLLNRARDKNWLVFDFAGRPYVLFCNDNFTADVKEAERRVSLRMGTESTDRYKDMSHQLGATALCPSAASFAYVRDIPQDLNAFVYPETREIRIGQTGLFPIEWKEAPKLGTFRDPLVIESGYDDESWHFRLGAYKRDEIHILCNETHLHVYRKNNNPAMKGRIEFKSFYMGMDRPVDKARTTASLSNNGVLDIFVYFA